MRRFKKSLITTALSLALILGMSFPVSAADSDNWNINYTPGAPSHLSIQNDSLSVTYYAGGFYAYATTWTGTNGSQLEITSSDAGGMKPEPVTVKGRTDPWWMYGETSGAVNFWIEARTGYKCVSTGYIHINN